MEEDLKVIGENIAKIRRDKRITEKRLSEISKVPLNNIKRIEKGEGVSVVNMLKVVRALKISFSSLLVISLLILIYNIV